MVKKIFFFSLGLISLQIYCMIKEKEELKQWVQNATEIKVHTEFLKDYTAVTIDDKTTVIQVKERLSRVHRISMHRLSLHALVTSWKELWLISKSLEKLANNQNIKQIMNDNNSDRFLLTVSDSDLLEKK
jgi:hypothetical protein